MPSLRQLKMRIKRWCRLPWVLVLIAAVNFMILLYFVLLHYNLPDHVHAKNRHNLKSSSFSWTDQVSFVFREFEDYENGISKTAKGIIEKVPDAAIIVISDSLPYPPIELPKTESVHLVTLDLQPDESLKKSRPENVIKTKYMLLLPDSVGLKSPRDVQVLIQEFESQPSDVKAMVWPIDPHAHLHCTGLNVKLREWTLQYFPSQSKECDIVLGQFITLMQSEDFFSLSDPFQRPLPEALFIQTALRGWKIAIGDKPVFQQADLLFQDAHSSWKHKTRRFSMLKKAYNKFGIKLIQKEDGQEEWYGCSKDSTRCFGTVINDMPEYLYRGRWTPPCCLKALRVTARHVFRILSSQDVRYWLEGGSLLGAARNGDIIPWDYDIDIGIYMQDIGKSYHLTSAQTGMYEDEDGYVWEKAREGEFYRVQYSQSNHLHVDIWPFFSKNGTMTKNTWMKGHRQDMAFAEKYLQPLDKISFVGMEASAPNNWKEFLELKFGEGVIENPKFPDDNAPIL